MKAILVVIYILIALIIPHNIYSHGANNGYTVLINDKPVESYPLENAGIYSNNLLIPSDVASEIYLAGAEIEFAINIVNGKEIDEFHINWDLGDGKKLKGNKVSHSYEKPGSYFINVSNVKDSEAEGETILIHIIPNINHNLPKAILNVNNQSGNEENFNILEFDLINPIKFDGSKSRSESSKISKYYWDFGDDEASEGIKVEHKYELPQSFATILLRVEDEYGLISDASVGIRNIGSNEPQNNIFKLIQGLGPLVTLILIFVVTYLFLAKKRRRSTD